MLAIIISAILRYLSSISFGNDFKFEEVILLLSTIYMGNIIVFGYGLQVTKDVIDGGRRLPKIMVKKGLSLGIKATILLVIFNAITFPLMRTCGHLFGINGDLPLYFLDCLFTDPIYLFETLGTYPPLNAILFFIISFAIGYLFLFFMEISFATLADTNSILNL
jgi:hypothetical protein